MQKKGFFQIYREGWALIAKALLFGIAIWAVALPFRMLEFYQELLPQWAAAAAAILMFFVYTPFAAYFVYHAFIDLGKTEHKYVPLIERLRNWKKKSEK